MYEYLALCIEKCRGWVDSNTVLARCVRVGFLELDEVYHAPFGVVQAPIGHVSVAIVGDVNADIRQVSWRKLPYTPTRDGKPPEPPGPGCERNDAHGVGHFRPFPSSSDFSEPLDVSSRLNEKFDYRIKIEVLQ